MSSGSVFELQIAAFAAKAGANAELVTRRAALGIFSNVIEKSPVDTGRFKGNWQCAISAVPAGETNTPDKSPLGDVGTVAIVRADQTMLDFKLGDVIYFVNNLNYSLSLEYGHSKQAPSGMVRLSIGEWNTAVAKAVSELPK